MKRITRTITQRNYERGEDVSVTFYLDQNGHWTRDQALAGAFEDAEAEQRVRRIPHAELESIENKQENGDV